MPIGSSRMVVFEDNPFTVLLLSVELDKLLTIRIPRARDRVNERASVKRRD